MRRDERDIAVTAIVLGFLPLILQQLHIGVLVWTWLERSPST